MKKLNLVMLVCAVVIAALLVVSLSVTSEVQVAKKGLPDTSVYSNANGTSSQESQPSSSPESAASSQKQALYLVKAYEGEIGIYRVGQTTPYRILQIPINTLPTADQQLLRSGISVQTTDELQSIIEDYNS